ncbi:MAG: hypothetical protein JWP00_2712 [Chloroflexi bacterium]|jgi:tRNA threonylcarbamoyladenosine biosynthesis protein TsaE|nr:hypothetical protein [Chloroflexota bacterium]
MTQNYHSKTNDKIIGPASGSPRDNRAQTPPSAVVDFVSHSITQTQRCGSQLAQHLVPGVIILLEGDLGAGKTTFTKGIASGMGVEGYVNSPTFTLVNEYEGRLPIYHLDCYRLESGQEALDFGIEEYLDAGGVTIIEWPERISEILPPDFIRVSLSYLTDTKRSLRLEPVGSKYIALMQEFKKSAFGSTL